MTTKQLDATKRLQYFGLIWFGQLISSLGSGLTSFALSVWIYQTTGSATQYALNAFFGASVSILMAPIAGVLADRWNRRWMMILGDTGAALSTFFVWLLFRVGQLEIWHIYIFVMFNYAFTTLQLAAYETSVVLLVPKEHLGRANGLIQLTPAATQIIRPVLAGALMVIIGVPGVIQIDLISFFFAVSTLFLVRIPKPEAFTADGEATAQEEKSSLRSDMTFGWNFIKARPGLLGLLIYFAFVNFTQTIVVVLISPLVLSFATPAVLGTVSSIAGVGMLLGALTISVWGGPKRLIHGVLGFIVLRTVLLFLGGLQPNATLIAIAAFVFLFASQVTVTCSQTIWQRKVAPDMQGRVFAVRRIIALASMPLSYLLAGPLVDNIFDPLLAIDGPLAGSVGRVIGTGPGRGVGFLFIVFGALNLLMTVAAYLYPRIRLVENELPDVVQPEALTVEKHAVTEKEGKLDMKRLRKILVTIGIILLVIVVILGGLGIWFVRRPWPQVSGTISVPGLSASVEVIRDEWGVPHIYAQNEHDLFFAQGYVHAQDRLWQMEVNRRLTNGRLSEVLGEQIVGFDYFFLTLGLRRVAEQSWPRLDAESQQALQTYADGVNAYIESHRDRLPLEFTILGVDPQPWSPIDSMAWGNMMALNMGINSQIELLQANMIPKLGEERTQELFPRYDEITPTILPGQTGLYDEFKGLDMEKFALMEKWLGNPYWSWASNNWVIHGSRTESGLPILANDTHMDLPMPSAWYENGLHGGRFDCVGFTLPGVPLIVTGHNQHIAWGITNLDPDVQDLYMERLDDIENPTQYEYMGEWHDLEIIEESIPVGGRDEPDIWKIYLTRHGPIINDIFAAVPEDAPPISLSWTLYEGSVVFRSIIRLNLATNWDEFHAALADWDTLSQNFVYADLEGNIGYQAAAKIPIRTADHAGIMPVPGWTGEYEWQGFVPYEELPRFLNPPAGFIATANNKVVSDDYPYRLWGEWFPGYRARRITDILAADAQATIEESQTLQGDSYSMPAQALRPYMLAVEPENDLQAKALEHLKDWDLYFETDRVGASVYETWYLFLLEEIISDELGEDLAGLYQRNVRKHAPLMIEWMAEPDAPWFDDQDTPEVETRDDILSRSLAGAVNWLSQHFGNNPDRWQWGRIHTATFVHTPLGQSGISVIENLFNSDAIPAPGSQFTVNNERFIWPEPPFSVNHGTAMRMIVDLSDLDNMSAANSTGQSEHLFHRNREDQIPLWQNIEYHSTFFTRQAVQEHAEHTLTLTP